MLQRQGIASLKAGLIRNYPYIVGLIVLIALVCLSRPFWLTNDDVAMSLIADGGGLADTPSPRIVLTNIAWGYLVYGFPSLGGIPSYTWVTYLALGLSCLVLLFVFVRSSVDPRIAAAAMVLVFAPTLIYPQFTLVAGYLAFAAVALACHAVASRSHAAGWFAGALVVLSGLVRFDETLLVLLVALPLFLPYWLAAYRSDQRRHWLMIAGTTLLVFCAFQSLDYLTFSTGQWGDFGRIYGPRTEFTDFKFADYFREHPATLRGSGFTMNDMRLLGDWFYVDTQVFTADKLSALLDTMPWYGRLRSMEGTWRTLFDPFDDAVIIALSVVIVMIGVLHRQRRYFVSAIVVLALVMVGLWLAGRPGITRIYISAFAGLVMVGVLQLRESRRGLSIVFTVVTLTALLLCGHAFLRNDRLRAMSDRLETTDCTLPQDSLTVVWGGAYPFSLAYLPFKGLPACPLHYYSLGEFSLAPYALDHLHAYTGGKDLVPALLAGQSFYFIADRMRLNFLNQYFTAHYSVRLSITLQQANEFFSVYKVVRLPGIVRGR